jgi:hypothetical protein
MLLASTAQTFHLNSATFFRASRSGTGEVRHTNFPIISARYVLGGWCGQ